MHALADAGVVTTVSLEVAADLPYEKRRLIAVYFGEMSRHLQWWVGDLLNDSEARDEHLFSQLAADTGLSEGALATRMYVCRRVAVKRRRAGLPFSVHHAVASLGARDQERWLKIAEAEQLTAQVLRERIKAATKDGQQELLDRDSDPPAPERGPRPQAARGGRSRDPARREAGRRPASTTSCRSRPWCGCGPRSTRRSDGAHPRRAGARPRARQAVADRRAPIPDQADRARGAARARGRRGA